MRAARHVLVLATVTIAIVAGAVLVGLDGWTYYRLPMEERSFSPAHQLLRPSAPVGHALGIGGLLLMLVPVAYAVRKKVRLFRNAGSLPAWLDVHIFAGIVGPALVTFHTAFKFNGIVAVAYWSMIAVVLSGFVGRYLYVRIPRSIRGQELSRAELDARAADLSGRLERARLPASARAEIAAFARAMEPPAETSAWSLFVGEWQLLRQIARLQSNTAAGAQVYDEALAVLAERATLVRRIAYLEKTKALFEMWHVFHLPLVYILFVIVILHVAIALYLGYVPFAG